MSFTILKFRSPLKTQNYSAHAPGPASVYISHSESLISVGKLQEKIQQTAPFWNSRGSGHVARVDLTIMETTTLTRHPKRTFDF